MHKYWKDLMRSIGRHISLSEYDNLSWNRVSTSSIRNSCAYNYIDGSNVCGLNLANKALRMWRYQREASLDQYPFTWMGFIYGIQLGPRAAPYSRFLACWFDHCDFYFGDELRWDFYDDTDYSRNSVISMIHVGRFLLHYFMVIGRSDDGQFYLVTDQSNGLYMVHYKNLSDWITVSIPTVAKYSFFRVGWNYFLIGTKLLGIMNVYMPRIILEMRGARKKK